MQKILTVKTNGPGLYEFTQDLHQFIKEIASDTGLLTLFVRHTSCSLTIQENADPDVQADLQIFFERLVPFTNSLEMDWIRHRAEGPDDMPAHIKAALTQTSLSIPIMDGQLALGTWQGVYLFEHRTSPHVRQIVFHLSA